MLLPTKHFRWLQKWRKESTMPETGYLIGHRYPLHWVSYLELQQAHVDESGNREWLDVPVHETPKPTEDPNPPPTFGSTPTMLPPT